MSLCMVSFLLITGIANLTSFMLIVAGGLTSLWPEPILYCHFLTSGTQKVAVEFHLAQISIQFQCTRTSNCAVKME